MMTINQVREELKEIRYYMFRKEVFEKSGISVGKIHIEERVALYNRIICEATPRLYDIYVSLYLENNTQESLSEKVGYSLVHINRLNTQLIKFFQQKLNAEQSA